MSASVTNTQYQREGLFQNRRHFQIIPLEKEKNYPLQELELKGGFTYKITGNHLFDVNLGYITKAPSLRNTLFQLKGKPKHC